MKVRLVILAVLLVASTVGCSRSGRYVLVAQNVSGNNELGNEGVVYRLDTEIGDVIMIRGVRSVRVLTPEETKNPSQAK